jgi:hypothetical protein
MLRHPPVPLVFNEREARNAGWSAKQLVKQTYSKFLSRPMQRVAVNVRGLCGLAHLQRGFSTLSARLQPPDDNGRPSLVKSFLYGSEKGQELQREMEQSYSKVLARGKYVHKINTHHVRPDKIQEYVALMFSFWITDVVLMSFQKLPMTPKIKYIWLDRGDRQWVHWTILRTFGSIAGILDMIWLLHVKWNTLIIKTTAKKSDIICCRAEVIWCRNSRFGILFRREHLVAYLN